MDQSEPCEGKLLYDLWSPEVEEMQRQLAADAKAFNKAFREGLDRVFGTDVEAS